MWKNIPNTNGYYSCNEVGEIKSNNRIINRNNDSPMNIKEHILKKKINNKGYEYVSLRVEKKTYDKLVHRLVATTWIPNPKNKETVNHIDGNHLNNSVSNLEWATQSENNFHRFNVLNYPGVGSKPVAKLDDKGNIVRIFSSCTEASRFLNNKTNRRGNISLAAKHHTKRYGCYWKYVE